MHRKKKKQEENNFQWIRINTNISDRVTKPLVN